MLPGVDHQKLLRFVGRIVGTQDAEDVVQSTYLKIMSTAAPYKDQGATYETWVFAIAKRAALDHLRALPPATDDLFPSVAPSSLTSDVEDILSRMDPVTADSWRCYVAGERPEGISLRTFRRRVAQARARLKEGLK